MSLAMPDGFDWRRPSYDAVYEARAERLKRIRAPGFDIAALHEYYKTRPAEFIHDWMLTFDPRNVEIGVPATVPFLLFPKQEEFINWLYDRWQNREDGLVEKSRDMGVSWLCVAFSIWMWRFYPGTVTGFGSRKESYVDDLNSPSSLFWKARKIVELMPQEFQPQDWNPKHAVFMKIINPENGATLIGEAGDNIGRGARASVYFVDEAAFLERPDAVDAALSQTANCKIHVSTPNGAGNPFYRKRHGGKVPVFVFDWKDDPRKGIDWYQKQVDTLDPIVLAQEVDRNYEGSISNAFISSDLVKVAQSRGPAEVIPTGGLRVGVDVARFGDDSSVISIRRGRVLLKQVVVDKQDVVQVASKARAEIVAYGEVPEQIAVDVIGIGAGVADLLRAWYPPRENRATGKRKHIVVDVNCAVRMGNGQDYNLRAFMWREMREWLATAVIPRDQDLSVDLTALRYLYKGGELLLESKDDAKRRGVKSPDRGDSLALTFAVPTIAEKEHTPTMAPYRVNDNAMGMLG